MCALRYAFDASNFVSLFYKIVKVDHGVSLVLIVVRQGLGVDQFALGDKFCKPTKMKRKIVVLVNTPRILSPGKSEKVLADEAKLYIKPLTLSLVGLLT